MVQCQFHPGVPCLHMVLTLITLCFCQKRAQISFTCLPLHHAEEKSGRPDCRRVLQTSEGAAQVHHCTFFTEHNDLQVIDFPTT